MSNRFPSEIIEQILSFDENYFEFSLIGNGIFDISPLRNLTNLTYLYLINNRITDIKPLLAD